MSSTDFEQSVKIIPFSGKRKDWSAWEERFLARAKRKGFKEVLLGREEIPAEFNEDGTANEIAGATAEEQKLLKTREKNELAYGELVLAMDTTKSAGKVAFNIVKRSKTKRFPDVNASDAWKGLCRKYAPKTAPSLAKLHKLFYGAKLRKGCDPDVFITYLEDLCIRMEEMGSEISDAQFLMHVLNNLTKEYEIQVTKIEDRVRAKENPLTIGESLGF